MSNETCVVVVSGDAKTSVPLSGMPEELSATYGDPPRNLLTEPSKSPMDTHQWLDKAKLFLAIAAWYIVGVGAIVTTKIILSDWNVPPLLLTFQQLAAASAILRVIIAFQSNGVQPLPWDADDPRESVKEKMGHIWINHSDFLLAGLFNGLDFLASNTAFCRSAASFVETIKSSDPITTTAIALAWNVDRLARPEAVALSLLIVGMLFSTVANSEISLQQHPISDSPQDDDETPLQESIHDATIVMVANLCFAFRAMFQKRYRLVAGKNQLNDCNLLCRMQQTGAAALFLPVLLKCTGFILRSWTKLPWETLLHYITLSTLNAVFYAVYK